MQGPGKELLHTLFNKRPTIISHKDISGRAISRDRQKLEEIVTLWVIHYPLQQLAHTPDGDN